MPQISGWIHIQRPRHFPNFPLIASITAFLHARDLSLGAKGRPCHGCVGFAPSFGRHCEYYHLSRNRVAIFISALVTNHSRTKCFVQSGLFLLSSVPMNTLGPLVVSFLLFRSFLLALKFCFSPGR